MSRKGSKQTENEKGRISAGDKVELIRVSVRNLVEFILRSGDIDNRRGTMADKDAMQMGSRLHRKIQGRMGADYHAEVPLKTEIDYETFLLVVEGRADGIFKEQEKYVIDEIKGVFRDVERMEEADPIHLAQAKCYACIYAGQLNLEEIGVQMTYANLDTEEIRRFHYTYMKAELESWFEELTAAYRKWADLQYECRQRRQASIKELAFPFPYREGQRELAVGVYRTIARRKNLFIQAPTGSGKTMAAVYPAVKAVGEGLADKIFYLTAKTITGTVAREAFTLLRERGYAAKTIQLTAKEKLCLCGKTECNPVNCPYAKGHFDRVNDAVYDLIGAKDIITREILWEQAEAYRVCPFELALDTASWVDNIICDYNYVFDPNVYLKRFFAEGIKGDYIFLVDEAHNLVERGREMYSAVLYKEDFLAVRKLVKQMDGKLGKELERCKKLMLGYKRECEQYCTYESVSELVFVLMRLAAAMDKFLQQNREFAERDAVLEFYFQVRQFLTIYDCVDEHYVIYTQHEQNGRFRIKLYCVDPSLNLQECMDRGNATVFFSATLLPIQYYKQLLSTKQDNYAVYARTAFSPKQHLLLIGTDVSSRYKRRTEQEYERIAGYIRRTIQAKKGNYMVFFPSYPFMQSVYESFLAVNSGEADVCIQANGMREEEREAFLAEFEKERDVSLAAFCVMGGIFGEGIDLKRERLIGVILVGTGLPQLSIERDILKNYYDERGEEGFAYAYRYPGMNKVLQAAGRVIRTIEDVGIIELLDERFTKREYKELFPREWSERKYCTLATVEQSLKEFWEMQQ